MGVPLFFKWISQNHPNVISRVLAKSLVNLPKIDNLYLDANGILHSAVQKVFFEVPKKRFAPKLNSGSELKSEISYEEKLEQVYSQICDYIDFLYKFVKPTKLFYIAIDGTAPVAKQQQQRQRRFKTALSQEGGVATFDKNAITPGTKFMYNLSNKITKFIENKKKREWKHLKIIFSPPSVSSEGEHKLTNFIRTRPPEEVHCMYGLDADLFMLSLGTHAQHFYLIREDQFGGEQHLTPFFVVDIPKLAGELTEQHGSEMNISNFIDDFIFLTFLIGNDFLHASPMFHDLEASLDYLLQKRKEILKTERLTCLDSSPSASSGSSNLTINLKNLTKLFCEIAKDEREIIESHSKRNVLLNLTLNNSFVDSFGISELNIDLFRQNYYKKGNIENTQKFCKHFIQGLDWVNYYYHNRPNNWRYIFEYHYSPLITDLANYLITQTEIKSVAFKIKPPLTPFQQLVCVIPPKSAKVIPREYRSVYTHPELKEYYPDSFKIDTEGKRKDWEGIAILPFLDIQKIIEITQNIKSDLDSLLNVAGEEINF